MGISILLVSMLCFSTLSGDRHELRLLLVRLCDVRASISDTPPTRGAVTNHLPPTWRGYTYQLLRDATTTYYILLWRGYLSPTTHYYMDSKELLASPTTSTTTSPLLLRGEPINYQSTTMLNYVQSSQTITMWSSSSSLRLFTNYDDLPTTHLPTFTTTTAVSNY